MKSCYTSNILSNYYIINTIFYIWNELVFFLQYSVSISTETKISKASITVLLTKQMRNFRHVIFKLARQF